MKKAFLRWFWENFDDLLALDLKVARILGAPSPHTLSSYSYLLDSQRKPWGQLWRPVIDLLFKWLFKQENHCFKDYVRVTSQNASITKTERSQG